ncbi:unnamed protein product, partial [Symbiodinium microadriaticum]
MHPSCLDTQGHLGAKAPLLEFLGRLVARQEKSLREVLAPFSSWETRSVGCGSQQPPNQHGPCIVSKILSDIGLGEPVSAPADDGWRFGEDDRKKSRLPDWVLEGDPARIHEGSKLDDACAGFAWRPGKDKCHPQIQVPDGA